MIRPIIVMITVLRGLKDQWATIERYQEEYQKYLDYDLSSFHWNETGDLICYLVRKD